jgi:predicted DNA binding CopG/RHH family protein
MLIRQTTDTPPNAGPKSSDKRRLTLAFDKAQLARLKEIAKEEGLYLKDLINQLIERYLAEHSA